MQQKAALPAGMLAMVLLLLLALGSCNFVLLKIMYASYGPQYSFFASQGVNLLYIVYGGIVLAPLVCSGEVPAEQRARHGLMHKFCAMGCLDTLGTFLTAMGAVYTPGQLQPLLNQTIIPLTMLFSRVWLRTRFSRLELCGAATILAGAILSIVPSLGAHASGASRWYSVCIYFASNIPMAASSVYKEASFEEETIHVIYLTQWVSIFQVSPSVFLPPSRPPPVLSRSQALSPTLLLHYS